MVSLKKCSKCGELKPFTNFGKDKYKKDGLTCVCKSCRSLASKEYYLNNKDAHAVLTKKYYENHKDEISLKNKVYYIENKDMITSRILEYRKTPRGIEVRKRAHQKRRGFGHKPLNQSFDGAHFHHLHINNDHDIGIYIPKDLHMSIYHNSQTGEGMKIINNLAFNWYFKEHLGFTIKGLI
jgi:hypothetical protein